MFESRAVSVLLLTVLPNFLLSEPSGNMMKYCMANIKFNVDFYKVAAAAKPQESFISSPLSVSTLFSMIWSGAKGNTADEIKSTLGYTFAGLDYNQLLSVYKEFEQMIGDEGNSQQSMGADVHSSVWISKTFDVFPQYKEILKTIYKAYEKELAFANATATDEINNWVKEKTKGKIPTLFDSPLSADTLLVLLNTVYFKESWTTKFPKDNTKDLIFHGEKGDYQVPMMNVKEKFGYYESDRLNSQVIELKYRDSNTSMVIILPRNENDLKSVEENLTAEALAECFDRLHGYPPMIKVNVSLPKFKTETKFELIPIMQALQLNDVFGNLADLRGISNESGLYVTEAVHKAFVEVDEEGTVAAAASGASMSRTAIIEKSFNANHSFLYFIRNTEYNLIFFAGRHA